MSYPFRKASSANQMVSATFGLMPAAGLFIGGPYRPAPRAGQSHAFEAEAKPAHVPGVAEADQRPGEDAPDEEECWDGSHI